MENLDVQPVNRKIWRRLQHSFKSFESQQRLLLKSLFVNTKISASLYDDKVKGREAKEIIKDGIKQCTEILMLLVKVNTDLLSMKREKIGPEVIHAFR